MKDPRTAPLFTALILCLASTAVFAGRASAADWDFGLRAGVYTEKPDAFFGVEGLTRIGGSNWFFNPNVEVVFVDNGDLATLNADFHYDFDVDLPVYLWVGGGPALILQNRDLPPNSRDDDDDTDLGANLLFGVGFKTQSAWRPYAQAKLLLADDNQAVVAVGVRF